MAFESLSEKFQRIFKELRSHGRLTEADVRASMKEVRMALLEADVNFRVVKSFVKTVEERAVGEDVMNGLNPGQMVVKIVHEELVRLLGPEPAVLTLPRKDVDVILLCGLQGAGKTTMAAKLAKKFLSEGRHPMLAALDVYRPAAIEQLQLNGEKAGVPVFSMGTDVKPEKIAAYALEAARKEHRNLLILDTAGRLHVDDSMMEELVRIKKTVQVDATLLTVDAMTGQDAVNVSREFNDSVGIDGVILTKLDGDTRGGAALSIRAVTGKPILYSGTGEKLTDLEQFYPDRMASRILGMGDVLSLIEKASKEIDEDEARKLEQKLKKGRFDYDDYLVQVSQMKKMGGLASIMQMLPGMGMKGLNMKDVDLDKGEDQMQRIVTMIRSMTPYERSHPDCMNLSRKNRIARGSGIPIQEIHRMVKQFDQTREMMKKMGNMKGRNRMKFPF